MPEPSAIAGPVTSRVAGQSPVSSADRYGSTPGEGESVDASTAGMTNDESGETKFPSFKGKDLDGNDVSSDELFSKNKVTVINF